jgi:hypothetical protein
MTLHVGQPSFRKPALLTLTKSEGTRLEHFLTESANLQLESGSVRRLIKLFPDFDLWNDRIFSALFMKPSSQGVLYSADERVADLAKKYPLLASWDPSRAFYVDETGDENDLLQRLVIPYFRAVFRATWVEPDARTRQWAWFMFRAELARIWDSNSDYLTLWDSRFKWLGEHEYDLTVRLPEPPPELPIEKALLYLLLHHKRARYCPNTECVAPYFFAARHSQRYCSETCAQSGERQAKRTWWAEHGAEWRESRRQEANKSGRRKTGKIGKKSTKRGMKGTTRSSKKGK